MANNEILPFAGTDNGTNLLTQAEYNADSQRPIGNQPGVARSKLVNKVLRQTSLIASAVAQFLANRQANDITDSLTPATLAGYFLNVIGGDIQKSSFNASAAGGTVDAIMGTFTPAITALSNGLSLFIRASGANTATTPTFTPNNGAVTAKAIVKGANQALVAGDIAGAGHWLELQYDSTLDKWVLQNPANGVSTASVASVQGAFKNLVASATGLNATVTVSSDEIAVEDSSNTYKTLRTVSLSINSAGSGANGLDTGSLAASTWYSVWAIYNPTTQTTAGLLSLSATAPTMPSGYTMKARVGWVRTDGTANKYPLAFKQYGRRVQYVIAAGSNVTAYPTMASGALGTYSSAACSLSAVSVSSFVPTTASRIVFAMNNANTSNSLALAPNAGPFSGWGSSTPPPFENNNISGYKGSLQGEILLESGSVYFASAGSSTLQCMGWEDNL